MFTGTRGGAGGGGGIDLYTAPTSPSVYDDEFDTSSLGGKWTTWGTVDEATVVSVDGAFADDETRLDLDFRDGYLAAQAGSAGGFDGIKQGTEGDELPDGWYVINVLSTVRTAQGVNNDGGLYFGLYHTASDIDASREGFELILPEHDGGSLGEMNLAVLGGGTGGKALGNGEGLASYVCSFGMPYPFFAIKKESATAASGWGCDAGGAWHWIDDLTYTGGGTIDLISLGWSNNSQNAPGNTICLIGFVRYYSDGSKFPPH